MNTTKYHMGEFPPKSLEWDLLIPAIGKAHGALGSYNGLLSAIPEAKLLLSPLTTNEARLSSQIEGTHVTLTEVLEVEAGGEPDDLPQERRDDAEEVLNYRRALQMSVAEMEEKGLTQHLMRQAHACLMRGVRGMDKSPGQYRLEQNWIGAPGSSIENASFIPIAPEHLAAGMEKWNEYLALEDVPDAVVQLAIAHVEFEALHPFKDGNGRLGRMLIPLFLYKKRILSGPNFYMSGYFEANKDVYLDRLRRVSSHGEWTEWCVFFLESVAVQAKENEERARNILKLNDSIRVRAADSTKSPHCVRAVDYIFHSPIFRIPQMALKTGIPEPTARRIVTVLTDLNILDVLRPSSGRRPAVYFFPELINTAEGRAVF